MLDLEALSKTSSTSIENEVLVQRFEPSLQKNGCAVGSPAKQVRKSQRCAHVPP